MSCLAYNKGQEYPCQTFLTADFFRRGQDSSILTSLSFRIVTGPWKQKNSEIQCSLNQKRTGLLRGKIHFGPTCSSDGPFAWFRPCRHSLIVLH